MDIDLVSLIQLIAVSWQVDPIRFLMYAFAALLLALFVVEHYKARRGDWDNLTLGEKVVVGFFLLYGIPLNMGLNYTLYSLVFGEWPPDGHMITQRMQHYVDIGERFDRDPWWLARIRRCFMWLTIRLANIVAPGHIKRRA